MTKRMLCLLVSLSLMLSLGLAPTAAADEMSPQGESIETSPDVSTFTRDASDCTPPLPSPAPQEISTPATLDTGIPLLDIPASESGHVPGASAQEAPVLEIDRERLYPGMDKTYGEGYSGTIANGTLRLVIPLQNLGGKLDSMEVSLDGLSLTQEQCLQKLVPQTVILESGEQVKDVLLADYHVQIPNSLVPGSYPVTLEVTADGLSEVIELPLPQNVEIKTPPRTEPDPPTKDPTTSTDPTTPSDPSTPTDPSIPSPPTVLEIDSSHIYSGMNMAYEDGYLPRIEDGIMTIVLPLLCRGELWDNKLDATVSLDTSTSSPFVVENFQKTFYLKSVTPTNSKVPQELYLVTIDIRLSDSRMNGTYPVTVNISGYDLSGNPVKTSFTLYITITDGKIEKIAKPVVDTPTAEPVVYISKTVLEPETAKAGESFTMTVTLKNSITTKSVRNMLVTVDTGNVRIDLDDDSNIFPISSIPAGGEVELTLHLSTDPSIPSGKYPINFSFKYDSSKTLNLSSTGSTVVEIQQPANMELVMPRFASSVSVGETVPVTFQVMNMGRSSMYNVRCVVSGFGFAPSNTGYIGTMEAGTSSNAKVELYIIALNASKGNENGSQYGDTVGTVTLYYEDETGREYQQEATFDTIVNRPVVQLPQNTKDTEQTEERAGSWWVSVAILGGVILAAVGIILFIQKKKRRGGNYL